jgi:hypothetical protein
MLRGLTKLLKFRFSAQSKTNPSYGEKSFDDIPVIRGVAKTSSRRKQVANPLSAIKRRRPKVVIVA